MSNPRPWLDPPHSDHATIEEAGHCPDCRQWTIDLCRDDSHGYLIRYFEPSHERTTGRPTGVCDCGCGRMLYLDVEHPDAIAVVRSPSPISHEALDTAWATGCNLGTSAGISEVPVDILERAGVPTFELIHQPGAQAALDALQAAGAEL